jgi:tetratricopeptide (TPR) repeat protein
VWRAIQAHLLIALSGVVLLGSAYAELSSLHALSVDKNGGIQLEVRGEGFDPMLRLQKETGGMYRIVFEGGPVTLSSQARQALAAFKADILRQYPEITQVDLQQTGQTVRLSLVSRRKMQPQILSNTGSQITLTLISAGKDTETEASSVPGGPLGKMMDSVELELDEQVATRQKQAIARREVIKAQERAWQAQADASPEAFSQLASATPAEATLTRLQTRLPAASLAEPSPVSGADGDVNQKVSPSPLRLSAPPNVLPGSAFDSGRERLYRAQASISGDSLYGLIQDPQVNPTVQKAIRQALQGQQPQAVNTLQDFLKSHPDEVSSQVALAMILLNNAPVTAEEREKAAALLRNVTRQVPYLPAYELLIRIALDENRLQDAQSLLEKAELLNAGHPMLLFLKGRLLEAGGKPETAKDAYQRALEQAPYLNEAHYRLAQLALKSGNLDAAQWELLQMLQLTPDDSRALKLLAFIAQRQGQDEQALSFYSKALQPDALLNVARMLAGQNQKLKAQSILQAVEALAEDKPVLLFNVGMLYAELHNKSQARLALNRFIQLQKDTSDQNLAQAKETLKKLGR